LEALVELSLACRLSMDFRQARRKCSMQVLAAVVATTSRELPVAPGQTAGGLVVAVVAVVPLILGSTQALAETAQTVMPS